MKLGLKLDGHKSMSKKNELLTYDKPKYIYLPLICSNDDNLDLKVKVGDHVLKGMVIAEKTGNFALPIHSSVSGDVTGIEEHTSYTGKPIKCLVIKNDKKEEIEEKIKIDNISNYSKEEFIKLLKDMGIRGLGGADFPTYVKYSTDQKIKSLIINAVECEPYITADYALMKTHYEEILECIDAIMTINNIPNAYIGIKKNNLEIINLLNTIIGTYPKIKIVKVPNVYPMGWEKNLVKYILHKDYNGLPISVGAVINNVSTIYAIYEALKYHKPLTDRIVTITGEMIKKPTNISVKIGTPVNELLELVGVKKSKSFMVAGGPMMGRLITNDDLVISSSINNILILPKKKEEIPNVCLRCGKCSSICPTSLSPVMIKDNIENIDILKELEPTRCIECGLCSYICPAKINVRDYVVEAKKKVKVK